MSTLQLLGLVAGGVALLLALITILRLHAFVALLVTSMVIAVLGGVPLRDVAQEIQSGMGSTLGYIAVVVGLGAMFGEMLRRSGGASTIASRRSRARRPAGSPSWRAATGK